MEAASSSEESVDFFRSTRRHISEDSILYSHRGENLKASITLKVRALARILYLSTYINVKNNKKLWEELLAYFT
jgi:hypothetical protein